VQRHVTDGVAQDGLLDDEDVAAGFLDLLHQIENVSSGIEITVKPVESSLPLVWPAGGGQLGLAAMRASDSV
jgi:hypothetical protein